jgi:hypothetical protein
MAEYLPEKKKYTYRRYERRYGYKCNNFWYLFYRNGVSNFLATCNINRIDFFM